MNKQPLLSICIATYNRAGFIGETLGSIIPQLTGDTELLVVDGASTDNTEAVVNRFVSQEPRLRYIRLPQKGGVDQDYCRAVELARGTFCWLFTDDDLLKPGAISAVLGRIAPDVSLIVMNAEVLNADLTKTLQARRVGSGQDRVYERDEFEALFADTGNYLSFIGGVVIRRELWLQREKTAYFGTEFVHIGAIFQSPLPGRSILIAQPYVSIRYGNAQWSRRHFEIWMYKWPRLVWSFDGFGERAKAAVTPREPWRNLLGLAVDRALGLYSRSEFRTYLAKEQSSSFWKLGAFLVASMPIGMLNAMMTLRYTLAKEKYVWRLHDLRAVRSRRTSDA